MRTTGRVVLVALVAGILALGVVGLVQWRQERARTPAQRLERCLGLLPEPLRGRADDVPGGQAAVWGKSKLLLCDVEMENAGGETWARPGPAMLDRPGIRAAAFAESSLWLAFGASGSEPARIEEVGFNPPTGMDGALQVFEDGRFIWLSDPAPVAVQVAAPGLRVLDAGGATAAVDLRSREVLGRGIPAQAQARPAALYLRRGERGLVEMPCPIASVRAPPALTVQFKDARLVVGPGRRETSPATVFPVTCVDGRELAATVVPRLGPPPPLPERVELVEGERRSFRPPCSAAREAVSDQSAVLDWLSRDEVMIQARLGSGTGTHLFWCGNNTRHGVEIAVTKL